MKKPKTINLKHDKFKKKLKKTMLIIKVSLVPILLTMIFMPNITANANERMFFLPFNSFNKDLSPVQKIHIAAFKACNNHGLDYDCIMDLKAMAHNEKYDFDCTAVGDFGRAHGCFQINFYFHPHITQVQARDPEFAAEWTLKRMISKGYPKYRSRAIMKHNGTPGTPTTLEYLRKVNVYVNN